MLKLPRMKNRVFLYLGGDSYPHDLHVEEALRQRLDRPGARFYGQREFCDGGFGFGARKSALQRACDRFARSTVVAIGRSSGGRIATQAAVEGAGLAAIVALGYPFRAPDAEDDPGRTRHLAEIRIPTLIFQGEADTYGTRAMALARYPLAPAIQIDALDADHELRLTSQKWDMVAHRIEKHADGQSWRTRFVRALSRPFRHPH